MIENKQTKTNNTEYKGYKNIPAQREQRAMLKETVYRLRHIGVTTDRKQSTKTRWRVGGKGWGFKGRDKRGRGNTTPTVKRRSTVKKIKTARGGNERGTVEEGRKQKKGGKTEKRVVRRLKEREGGIGVCIMRNGPDSGGSAAIYGQEFRAPS